MAQRVAPVPALESRPMTGADGEFAALNKQLRACYVCKLIKTGPQFLDSGCENCRWMAEEIEHSNLDEFTTSNFSGLMTVMDPKSSWVSKWTHTAKAVPGCYALSLNDPPPRTLQEKLESRGIRAFRR